MSHGIIFVNSDAAVSHFLKVLFVGTMLTLGTSCGNDVSNDGRVDRIQHARNILLLNLSGYDLKKHDPKGYLRAYKLPAYRNALGLLKGKTARDFEGRPVVYLAYFAVRTDEKGEHHIGAIIEWIIDGSGGTGIYLANSEGKVLAKWESSIELYREVSAVTVLRTDSFYVALDGKKTRRLKQLERAFPGGVVSVPSHALVGELWVGIILKDGRKSPAAKAYIKPALQRLARRKFKGK